MLAGDVADARQRVDDLADEALHLLRVGSHGVDMELVFAGDAVDLRDGIAGVQMSVTAESACGSVSISK